MQVQKTYYFDPKDCDRDGRNKFNPEFLCTSKMNEFEKDFIEEFSKLKAANYFQANHQTMMLLEPCFELKPNERFGMDLIDGEINLNANLEIEEYSTCENTYAIGSYLDEDEPLFLVIDDGVSHNQLLLKYLSDGEGEVGACTPVIIDKSKREIIV